MVKHLLTKCVFSLAAFSVLLGQDNHITSIGASSNQIVVHYSIPENDITLRETEGGSLLEIKQFMPAGSPGSLLLPERALSVALPAGAQPQLSYQVLNRKIIPTTKPKAFDSSESFNTNIWRDEDYEFVSIKEIGWVDGQYCAVLQLKPARFVSGNGYELSTSFQITISFSSETDTRVLQNMPRQDVEDIPSAIVNKSQAVQWRTKAPTVLAKTAATLPYQHVVQCIVDEEGIYSVTMAEISDAGLHLMGLDPKGVRVSNQGREIPVIFLTENEDEITENDRLIFLGKRNRSNGILSQYSEENVYSIWHGSGAGLRFVKTDGGLYNAESRPAEHIWNKPHFEVDSWFDRLLLQYDGAADHWFYKKVTAGNEASFPFELHPPLAPADSAFLDIEFMGNTHPTFSATDHSAEVFINGNVVTKTLWDGQTLHKVERVGFPVSFLKDDENLLTVNGAGDSEAGEIDQFYVNWFEIAFPQKPELIDGRLEILHQTPHSLADYEMQHLADAPFFIISDDGQQFLNYKSTVTIPDSSSIRFQDRTAKSGKKYYVFTEAGTQKPKELIYQNIRDVREETPQSDYLIITTSQFSNQLNELIAWRENQGFRVGTVLVQDIFNTYSGGNYTPVAIRQFLKDAYANWQTKPKYVLLVGDGHYGFKKRRYEDVPSHVPTFMAYTVSWGLTASDNFYAEIDGDDIMPEIAVGRLPCNSAEELQAMIAKTIAYERDALAHSWNSDINLSVGSGDEFETHADELNAAFIPKHYRVKRLYTNEDSKYYGSTDELLAMFNNGALFMNFQGHGGGGVFFDSQLFLLEDIARIFNKDRWPILFSWSCFIGYFDDPHNSSLGEMLVRTQENGTVAGFGSSGRAWLYGDQYFNNMLFDELFEDKSIPLGEHIRRAKVNLFLQYGQRDLVLNYNLIGDPALRIRYPKEDVQVNINPKVYSSGDDLLVKAALPSGTGTALVETTIDDDEIISSDTLAMHSAVLNHTIKLPANRIGDGRVRIAFWRDKDHSTGTTNFVVDKAYFGTVTFQPSPIIPDNPFKVGVNVFPPNQAKIDSLFFIWWMSNQEKDSLQMALPTAQQTNFYLTENTLRVKGGITVNYQFKAKMTLSGADTSFYSAIKKFKIPEKADIRFAGSELRMSGRQNAVLQLHITNIGETEAGAFEVALFERNTTNGETTLLNAGAVSGLDSRDTTSVEITWPNPKPGWQSFLIKIDHTAQLDEKYTSNNSWYLNLPVATYQNGTGGALYTADSAFAITIPARGVDKNTILKIENWQPYNQLKEMLPFGSAPLPLETGYNYFLEITENDNELVFDAPVELKLFYNPQDTALSNALNRDELRIYSWSNSSQAFQVHSIGNPDNSTYFSVAPDQFSAIGLVRVIDKTEPVIEVNIDGRRFTPGDYVQNNARFSIIITDQAGLKHENPDKIRIDEEIVPEPEIAISKPNEDGSILVFDYAPKLGPGHHNIQINSEDLNGNKATATYDFIVADGTKLISLANHPNPFQQETIFAYALAQEALSVELKIYTVAGRLVRSFTYYNEIGYIEHMWDGRDENGEQLANGVYYLHYKAAFADEQISEIRKIARLQ